MQQIRLLPVEDKMVYKSFVYENIKAIFNKIKENDYEVLLEVNSNKFLIHIKTAMNKIEEFEILAIKGFIEISLSLLKILKTIVYKLYFEA
jgi:hypothetical protein